MKNIEELKMVVGGTLKLATAGVDHGVGKGLVKFALVQLGVALENYFDAIDKEIEGLQSDVRSAEADHDKLLKVMEMQQPVFEAATRQAEESPWDGEGLPPVGTVCEVLWSESRMEFLRTKVFGVNEYGQPIHRFDEGPKKYQYQADVLVTASGTNVFRPIRTAEQIAAEEREKGIQAIQACLPGGSGQTRLLIERLYDAGCRKQAQP